MIIRQYRNDLSSRHRTDCFLRLSVQLLTTQSLVRENFYVYNVFKNFLNKN